MNLQKRSYQVENEESQCACQREDEECIGQTVVGQGKQMAGQDTGDAQQYRAEADEQERLQENIDVETKAEE